MCLPSGLWGGLGLCKKTPKIENSNLHGFELHRPSSKGTKLLLQVIKAIINQFPIHHCDFIIFWWPELSSSTGEHVYLLVPLCTWTLCLCSLSIPPWLALQVVQPADWRIESPDRALHLPVSHDWRRVYVSFHLVHQAFPAWCHWEAAFYNRSAVAHNKIDLLIVKPQIHTSD